MRNKITELYGERILRKSAMNIRGGAGVFEKCLSGKGYKKVVEIGTYRGCSTAEISQYCEQVITMDLKHGKLEQNSEKWDREEFWKKLGIDNIEFIAIEDDEEKTRILSAIDFDFAFIDGGHSYGSVRKDFELVKKCGKVLFHDYDTRGKTHLDYVYEFVNSLPKNQVQVMDIFALWTI